MITTTKDVDGEHAPNPYTSLKMNSSIPHKPAPCSDERYTFLSSRSYLELAREARQEREDEDDMWQRKLTSPSDESSLKNEEQPGRAFRPRVKLSSQKEAGIVPVSQREGSGLSNRPARKRGRPRLEKEKDTAAIQIQLTKTKDEVGAN